MTTSLEGLPLCEPTASTLYTTSIPSRTLPNTTWRPSSQAVLMVVTKNCDPFVLGPALAMERSPAPECLMAKLSSANFSP